MYSGINAAIKDDSTTPSPLTLTERRPRSEFECFIANVAVISISQR